MLKILSSLYKGPISKKKKQKNKKKQLHLKKPQHLQQKSVQVISTVASTSDKPIRK